MARAFTILALLALVTGCTSDDGGPPAAGDATPTVSGGTAPAYTDYATARQAFTRRSADEVLGATLKDAAWLRFEGEADSVRKAHRAYFEYGYTSFQVTLRAKEYTRPTEETFLLEDDAGARVQGKPVTFKGSLQLVGDRWEFTFELSFQHTITKDTRWLRLTRLKDGSQVEWSFR